MNAENRIAPLLLDRASVREVDRAAIEDYGIPGIVLMENAARGLAQRAMEMLEPEGRSDRAAVDTRRPIDVLIICGSGNNGGDGCAVARHLHNAGAQVVLVCTGEPKAGTDAAVNREICNRMNLTEIGSEQLDQHRDAALIVDALFGTGLDRPVRGEAAKIIEWINAAPGRVLSVDVPSGMDCDTGEALGICVQADVTVTFVALKPGFLTEAGRKSAGRVIVADIGVPRELIERLARPAASTH